MIPNVPDVKKFIFVGVLSETTLFITFLQVVVIYVQRGCDMEI